MYTLGDTANISDEAKRKILTVKRIFSGRFITEFFFYPFRQSCSENLCLEI